MGDGAGPRVSSRWPRRARSAAVFLCLTVVAFWLFEGLCSVIWVSSRMVGTRLTAERLHTRYDRELGWVSIPDLSLPDLYGPGLGLTTNARGFRGPGRVEPLAPGARRVICSGDSFTLGYGVGDLETWCSQLGSQEPRLDAVNMGQGGYGVDQAYLWYKRDGRGLDHQAHVFAFITDDLRRMLETDFHGFGKPHLEPGGRECRDAQRPRPPRGLPVALAHQQPGQPGAAALLRRGLGSCGARRARRSPARRSSASSPSSSPPSRTWTR